MNVNTKNIIIVIMQKKVWGSWHEDPVTKVGGGFRVGWGGQGGCERRIEVIVKMKKNQGGTGVGWDGKVSVDVKLKLLIK